MKEIRRYPDYVLFLVYIVFVISIFLQACSTSWVRHSYCAIPLYCQDFPNLKINHKKVFPFMLKFPVFELLMHFMNRFCCRLWASRLTNIFPLIIFFFFFFFWFLKGTGKKGIQVAKLNLAKFATYEALIYKNIFDGNFLEGIRKARK